MKKVMLNSKFQAPTPREIPNMKHQIGVATRPWRSKLGASLVLGACCLMLLGYQSARAQIFTIDWFTVDGGGGTSTGGVFSVSGTIGQPDAGHMSGGNFTIDGGFWGIIGAIQSPGSPLLRVLLTSTNTVVVAWPAPSTGFSLQQNTDLRTTAWT